MADIQIKDRTYTAKELVEIRHLLMNVEKNNASGAADTSNPPYGPYADGSGDYGVFSMPGVRPEMFSAFSRPRSLSSQLGVRPSRITNEKIGILTGLTAEEGTNPADFCATAPTAGQLKRCVQNYIWGKSYWKSKVRNLAETGEYADYSDVAAKRVLNTNPSSNPFVPDVMGRLDIANRDGATLANELFTVGAAMERSFEKVLVQGNATKSNATTQLGFIREFDGLERQVITGRRDFDTNQLCAGADSTVLSWGTGIDATVSGRTFPQMIVDTYFGLNDIADQVGMSGTRWIIAMRMEQFRALTYIYACEYWTSRCQGSAGNPSYQNATEVRGLQLQMWQGRYLLIDGTPVQVIFTDGIPLTKAGGSVYTAQDMFFLAVDWNGMPLLNLEYKVMDNGDMASFNSFVGPQDVIGMNNGMWLVTKERTNFCMELLFAGKFRLVLDAPFLSAVINTMQFSFAAPVRNAYPDMTQFYVDGGATRFDGASSFS